MTRSGAIPPPAAQPGPQPLRPAQAGDVSSLAGVLARAFHDDPLWSWLLPDPSRRPRKLHGFFARFLRASLGRGDVVLTSADLQGVAVWRRPGRWRETNAEVMRLVPAMLGSGMRGMRRMLVLGREVQPRHPHEHHWYLAVLGTDPAAQGRGIGSGLVRAGTDLADHDGLPAYLETETAANVAFYRRHSFTTREELDVGTDGPHLWLLWRSTPE
ncbi:MAG: GNAT family N-acetyltransferase [Acidimicrobiia bacterium]|nr:GNAT family N-acetyltransferase [Acidimicrobiia bacterium]